MTVPPPTQLPACLLALTLFLLPALGVPSELVLQDTLKSAVLALGVLCTALVFFWQQRQRKTRLLWHGLMCLPLALMAYALASMAWSHTYLAGVEAVRWFILSLLLWLALNCVRRDNLHTLLWGLHGGACVAALWAGAQFWFGLQIFPQAAVPASTFVNRNFYAEYAVSVLPFSALLLLQSRASRWLPLLTLSLAYNIVALMMTGTRSALVALLLVLPVLLFTGFEYRQHLACGSWSNTTRWGVVALILGGILGLGSIPMNNAALKNEAGHTALERSFARTSTLAQGEVYTQGSFSVRAQMWKATARMITAQPWAGVGAGAWEVQIPLYQNPGTVLEIDYYAHNELLQLLGEYGAIVGGGVIAFLLAYLLLAAQKTWALRGTDLSEVPLRAVLLCSLLAQLVVGSAGFPWHLASVGALLALGLGLLAGTDARLGFNERFFVNTLSWRPALNRICLGLLATSALLAIFVTERAVQAERKLIHAIHMGNGIAQARLSRHAPSTQKTSAIVQSLHEGVTINPHYRKLTAVVANQLMSEKQWPGAILGFESISKSRPHLQVVWAKLAICYTENGQPQLSSTALQTLHKLRTKQLRTSAQSEQSSANQ